MSYCGCFTRKLRTICIKCSALLVCERSHFIVLAQIFKYEPLFFIMNIIKCSKCGETKEHQAKGLCFNCYRKYAWKQKNINCKRCGRNLPNHAKGFCAGCYNFVFHSDTTKARNHRVYHNIDPILYKKITEKCVLCDFNRIIDLHHLDQNKENNSENNLIGLCPNHHKMFHDFRFKEEIIELLKEKGFLIPEDKKLQFKI